MASYFQSYFQASSMPKRLLQYALSRLEILDTDALDLENLDIAFGKNSTFEFRDVGLKSKKLESLLQLPPSFELLKSRVTLLRLTIPVDIYSSPIVVEVNGVECHLCVKSRTEKGATSSTTRTNHDRIRKRPVPKGTRGYRSRRGIDLDDDSDSVIPTAANLAQSFLQTEPEEEKAGLEAVIMSETQDFGTGSVMSDDDEVPVGTGTALSLPAFMAGFLQGIVDRLQVRISGVTFNLDVEIPSESDKISLSSATDPITLQLRIDNIDIEGVTHKSFKTTIPDNGNSFSHKEGKRMVSLSQIRGALICEAKVFSSLARSSAMSSPTTAHSDISSERRNASGASSLHGLERKAVDGKHSSEKGSTVSSSRLSSRSAPGFGSDPGSLRSSVVISEHGRFDDALDEEAHVSGSIYENSEIGNSIFLNSTYLDQISESQYLDKDEDEEEDEKEVETPSLQPSSLAICSGQPLSSPSTTPTSSVQLSDPLDIAESRMEAQNPRGIQPSMLHSTILPPRPKLKQAVVSHSQPSLPVELNLPLGGKASQVQTLVRNDTVYDSDGSDELDDSTPTGETDLAESQLFSHEDAESMYMSAISGDFSPPSKVPGGWNNSNSDSDGRFSPPESSISTSPKVQRDNLEHALHVSPTHTVSDLASKGRSPSPIVDSAKASSTVPLTTRTTPYNYTQSIPSIPQRSSDPSEPSTPLSDEYTKLSKQLFCLDQVDIYIPVAAGVVSGSGDEPVTTPPFDKTLESQTYGYRSASANVPGAFSVHLPSESNPPKAGSSQKSPSSPLPGKASRELNSTIEILLGSLEAQFDISIGRLLCKLIQYLKSVLGNEPPLNITESRDQKPNESSILLGANEISLKFLERLEGTSCSSQTLSEASRWVTPPESDVLLRTAFTGLNIHTRTAEAITKTSVTVKKFIFGYSQENIVSFDAAMQMRASVRDLKASEGLDISANITKTSSTTRFEAVTLPMHVSIDLQKLDDTFSWFGGLSSVLNLGSSIASNATITAATPLQPKPRGVRFETPINPEDKSQVAQNKADVRLGGLVLDLVGAACSIGVETSAVKIVHRDEGIGASIQKIMLSGPHLKRSNDDPAISIEVTGTRVEYLTSPKNTDLDRLLSLITPSKVKYDQDDDILLDTLLRQRKQGAVLRLTVDSIQTRVEKLDELSYLPELGEEISRLATVAKYLPDDDRPGLLSLILVHKFDAHVDVNNTLGNIQLSATEIEVAQITLPALVALSVNSVSLRRNVSEELLGIATDPELREPRARAPAIMARMIGDEMEPTIKVKLWNLRVEYRVPTLVTLLGLADDATSQDISASLTASVATLTGFAHSRSPRIASVKVARSTPSASPPKPMNLDVTIRDCILGLNPLGLPSKVLLVLSESHLIATLPSDQNATASLEVNKASILVIDNVANILSGEPMTRNRRQSLDGGSSQVSDLCSTGYVSISYISSAKAVVQLTTSEDGDRSIDVELRDDLFVLESCADSTQTLFATLSGLTPPTVPSKETKYRTTVIPVEDLLASLSGDAFGTAEGAYNFDDDFGHGEGSDLGELLDGEGEGIDDLDFDSHYYQNDLDDQYNEAVNEDLGDSLQSAQLTVTDTQDGILLDSIAGILDVPQNEDILEFQEDHFGTGSIVEGTAHRWNSSRNTYDKSNGSKLRKSPLKVCVRDVHIIWNLFDGYDWQHTRDTISKAVQDVESKAIEKRARNDRRSTFDLDMDEEDTVIGDFLFNSIYIEIPSSRDPRELSAAINQELNDNATETESVATTSLSSSPSGQTGTRRPKSKRLRLDRSRRHKITFELKGISVDLVAFPPGSGETQSSVDIRVRDLVVFDHIPTSTWKLFASYMQEAGERETGSNMVHIEILNVKPVPDLAAAEIVLKASILPLRLHVDQDALDFITRFFEFKDDSAPSPSSPGDMPFLQRVEVNSVVVKLDFKPKRVDYAGLRSGHTTEFMNFLILEEADMILKHTIIYGVSGFDKLGKCLNDIWMPEIKRNQLPGILAGLAPVRSLVNVGGGLRHLVVVPMREYKKDGRIVRSISKGAAAFAKTTGTELVKLGAKVAIGVQTVLQGAEGLLGPTNESPGAYHDGDESEEDTKKISLYANQPVGVMQGLRGGYAGLQRDLVLARDAIIAVPGEVMEGGNAAGVLRAVRKHAPTVILRPAIGVAKAGGQILMGATNSLDPSNLQRADAKYKKH